MSTFIDRAVQCRDSGAAFLDAKIPGWHQNFTEELLDKLDVNCPNNCILSGASGKYFWDALIEFGICPHQISEYGFATFTNNSQDPVVLANLWKEVILERQSRQQHRRFKFLPLIIMHHA